jgi:hypothetical protein
MDPIESSDLWELAEGTVHVPDRFATGLISPQEETGQTTSYRTGGEGIGQSELPKLTAKIFRHRTATENQIYEGRCSHSKVTCDVVDH